LAFVCKLIAESVVTNNTNPIADLIFLSDVLLELILRLFGFTNVKWAYCKAVTRK